MNRPGPNRTLLATALLILLFLSSCGSDDGSRPDPQGTPAVRIHVAPGGSGSGGADDPFGSIEAAVAASSSGDTISLAAGDYDLFADLAIVHPLVIEGAGRGATLIDGGMAVSAPDSSRTVLVRDLTCDFIAFAPGCPDHPSKLLVEGCTLDQFTVSLPPNHVTILRDCDILGAVGFSHGDGQGRHVVEDSRLQSAGYSHGNGEYHNVLADCEITGGIYMSQGDGGTVRIEGCTVGTGLSDSSGQVRVIVRDNHFLSGGIADASGGLGDPDTEDFIVEDNVFDNGSIVSSGASISLRRNQITVLEPVTAVYLTTGPPCNIVDNVITVPETELPPDFSWLQPGMVEFVACIYTASNTGEIVGNEINGGALGLYDNSGAVLVADNVLSGQEVGILTIGGGEYRNNQITGCTGDGLIFCARGPIVGNTITGCGGAGLRLCGFVDLGGGPDQGTGGNVLTGNAGFDLFVEVSADAGPIPAAHNIWDHLLAGEVHDQDIWDGNDDPAKAAVTIEPLGER